MRIVGMVRVTSGASSGWEWTLVLLGVLLAWDAGGLDLPLARLMGGLQGFPLRDHWILSGVLHDGARQLAWLACLWLLAGVWWPTGVLRRLARRGRVQWLASTAISLVFISALKYSSHSSCPWDLAEFGGPADYLSHWAWGRSDGGPGRCFPAGHASAAFAFLGGYFVVREECAEHGAQYLAIVLFAGTLLGVAQQLRGAHFMSHTLWTAGICWAIGWTVDRAAGLSKSSSRTCLS
jgi:membrane-associated PAP2 superfamily phosphatase